MGLFASRMPSASRLSSRFAVTFWPDGTIFDELEFSSRTILERLQQYAFLNRNLEIRFNDERRQSPVRCGQPGRQTGSAA